MRRKAKAKWNRVLVTLFIVALVWLYQRFMPRQTIPDRPPPTSPTELDQPPRFDAQHPQNFDQAKRILRELFPRGQELYCACTYDLEMKRVLDFKSCGFKAKSSRGHRIEWEHVVPASVYGRRFKEWTAGASTCSRDGRMQKGRSCARDASEVFRRMEADLYNLLPAVGELNRARSNFSFAEVQGEPRAFGACDFEVAREKVEPRPEIRGDIARIYFYMDARYPGFGILDPENADLLSAWNRDDPLDQKERDRLRAIEAVQGNSFFIGRLSQVPADPPSSMGKSVRF